jgi:hypothetical protein
MSRSPCYPLFALLAVACGANVSPANDATAEQPATIDASAPADATDARERDTSASDRPVLRDAADATDASNGGDESLRPPFSRVEFIDSSLRRATDEWETLRARRFAPSGGGTWRRSRSRNCFVEFGSTPIYTPFADAVEFRSIEPPGATQTAQLRPDDSLEWWGADSTYYAGDRLQVSARRSDWPTEWTTNITVPTSVRVIAPTFTQALEVSYSTPLLFRWSSAGVDPEAIVRISYSQRRDRGSRANYEEWRIICEFEAWREQATILMQDHPEFPSTFAFPHSSIVIDVNTVLSRLERLPNGDVVLVEEQASSASYAPGVNP